MTVSAELRRAYASAVDDRTPVSAIAIAHPGLSRIWRITDHHTAFSAEDENGTTVRFTTGPISIAPAGQNAGGRGTLGLKIGTTPDILRELVSAAQAANAAMTLVFYQYLLEHSLQPQWTQQLQIAGTEIMPDEGVIVAEAGTLAFEDLSFPRAYYRAVRWPGTDR